ncbi:helix-turn-helix transcriptional regulator [Mycobacterium talmoniae]|uniref:Uncharacterized protein n=1 Tax=Mycobacterium talmoniae TaxID=1858794 RepID=A0A1S1NI81_9MYCO|nr:helix-turn-helix domain-containing protein [Mycobacterium talmoniae]OHV03539.1 hypothetical protein BKN37_14550 [Mycobacterium talmoniae]
MNVWSERTSWNTVVWLNVERTAELTGLKVDTIYHYVSRKDPKFPQPDSRGGRTYFAGEQVLRYILEHRRRRRSIVSRLFPRVPDPNPAQFMSAEPCNIPDIGRFAIHTWRPSDGAGPVAIAYPDRENTLHINNVPKAAAALLNQLPPRIDAVAVPNGETASLPDDRSQTAPIVVVAERQPVYRYDPVDHGAARYKWWDLANLLRVDLPWWSPLLNDLDAMLAWRPGASTEQITPYTPSIDPGHITALASPGDSAPLCAAVDKLAQRILIRLNGRDRHDTNCLTPGLVQAAVSTVDPTEPVPELTADEAALILHHRADRHAATHALRVADHWAFMPVLTHAIKISASSATAMARQWAGRLTDVAEQRRTELGFWHVSRYMGAGVEPVRWLTDLDNPHTWAIEANNGTIYAGVGTSTPGALGQLTEAEIDHQAAFFRDTAGQVWPVPDTGFDYYRTGYNGAGPQRLAETLTLLAADARTDVHKPPHFDPDTDLYRLISTHDTPLTVTAELLAAARASRA